MLFKIVKTLFIVLALDIFLLYSLLTRLKSILISIYKYKGGFLLS